MASRSDPWDKEKRRKMSNTNKLEAAAAASSDSAGRSAGAGERAGAGKAKRAANPAFMKALKPSAELSAVVGADPLARTEVIKKLWEYIKAHDLQDPKNKRMINADARLRPVFGTDQVSMFDLAGLVGKHLS